MTTNTTLSPKKALVKTLVKIGMLTIVICVGVSGIIYAVVKKHSESPYAATSVEEDAYLTLNAASNQVNALDEEERKALEKQTNRLTATEKTQLDAYLQLAYQVNAEVLSTNPAGIELIERLKTYTTEKDVLIDLETSRMLLTEKQKNVENGMVQVEAEDLPGVLLSLSEVLHPLETNFEELMRDEVTAEDVLYSALSLTSFMATENLYNDSKESKELLIKSFDFLEMLAHSPETTAVLAPADIAAIEDSLSILKARFAILEGFSKK